MGLGRNGKQGRPFVLLWGTGKARREFLHVDDMASACYHVMSLGMPSADSGPGFFNIGTGKDVTISEVAEMIRRIVGFEGETLYNSEKPDGTPQKLLNIARINAKGWRPVFDLEKGLRDTYAWYVQHLHNQ